MAIHQFDEREAARLDKQYAIPIVVEQRRRTLEALDARAGERILDVGSGPAFLTADIARIVGPGGRVCAVDASEPMLEVGRRRCASLPMAEFQHGDARKLPYPDASFDAVVAVQVYLFVPELDAALAELRRVLRPGGRAIVMDTDWGSTVWNSRDPARMARVLEIWKHRYSNAHIGRVLPGALRRAGLVIEDAKAVPIVELAATEEDYSGGQLKEIAKYVAGRHGMTTAEAQAWKDELLALEASGEYFFSLNRYLFVARRPGWM
jgi:arsenite methyltransferase